MRRRSPLLALAALAAAAALLAAPRLAAAAQPQPDQAVVDCPQCNGGAAAPCRSSRCREPQPGRPDLFYNFYVPPTCGGVGAQLYVAPHPVPAHVGQTYYTYQPLMPHEMMYRHHRYYYRYYDGGRGLTRTRVIWW